MTTQLSETHRHGSSPTRPFALQWSKAGSLALVCGPSIEILDLTSHAFSSSRMLTTTTTAIHLKNCPRPRHEKLLFNPTRWDSDPAQMTKQLAHAHEGGEETPLSSSSSLLLSSQASGQFISVAWSPHVTLQHQRLATISSFSSTMIWRLPELTGGNVESLSLDEILVYPKVRVDETDDDESEKKKKKGKKKKKLKKSGVNTAQDDNCDVVVHPHATLLAFDPLCVMWCPWEADLLAVGCKSHGAIVLVQVPPPPPPPASHPHYKRNHVGATTSASIIFQSQQPAVVAGVVRKVFAASENTWTTAVAWMEEPRRLVTGSSDGTVHVWQVHHINNNIHDISDTENDNGTPNDVPTNASSICDINTDACLSAHKQGFSRVLTCSMQIFAPSYIRPIQEIVCFRSHMAIAFASSVRVVKLVERTHGMNAAGTDAEAHSTDRENATNKQSTTQSQRHEQHQQQQQSLPVPREILQRCTVDIKRAVAGIALTLSNDNNNNNTCNQKTRKTRAGSSGLVLVVLGLQGEVTCRHVAAAAEGKNVLGRSSSSSSTSTPSSSRALVVEVAVAVDVCRNVEEEEEVYERSAWTSRRFAPIAFEHKEDEQEAFSPSYGLAASPNGSFLATCHLHVEPKAHIKGKRRAEMCDIVLRARATKAIAALLPPETTLSSASLRQIHDSLVPGIRLFVTTSIEQQMITPQDVQVWLVHGLTSYTGLHELVCSMHAQTSAPLSPAVRPKFTVLSVDDDDKEDHQETKINHWSALCCAALFARIPLPPPWLQIGAKEWKLAGLSRLARQRTAFVLETRKRSLCLWNRQCLARIEYKLSALSSSFKAAAAQPADKLRLLNADVLESALCHADFAVLVAQSAAAGSVDVSSAGMKDDHDRNNEQVSVCMARAVDAQESLGLATAVYELVSQLTGESVERVSMGSERAPRRYQQQQQQQQYQGLQQGVMGMEDTGVQMGIAMRGVSDLRDVAHAVKIVQATNDMLGLRYELDGLPVFRSAVTFRLLVGDQEATVQCELCGVYAEDPDAYTLVAAAAASTATGTADGTDPINDCAPSSTMSFLFAQYGTDIDATSMDVDVDVPVVMNGRIRRNGACNNSECALHVGCAGGLRAWRCPVCYGRFARPRPFRGVELAPPPVQL